MTKNKVFLLGLLLCATGISAQNIYTLGNISSGDLSGTARYVGMGGAMNALGADLSVMSSNPAGIGLYRRSDVAMTIGLSGQEDAQKFHGKDKTHLTFDNLGFVYAMNTGNGTTKFVNIGFNYRKHKDFSTLINTSNDVSGSNASQSWQMADLADYWYDATNTNSPLSYVPPIGQMGYNNYLINELANGGFDAYGASANAYRQAQWGSIQEYDISLAFNFSNQFYLGFDVGMNNVNYKSYTEYDESLINAAGAASGDSYLTDHHKLSGTGVDFKLGFIARPVKDNPFRFGISVITPTFYDLKHRNTTYLDTDYSNGNSYSHYTDVDYKYNLYTPWRFNLSLGSTFFNQLAVGAEYEYADFSKAKIAYDNGYWDEWGADTDDDEALKDESDRFMKGVHTFKLGAEWYIDKNYCIRVGYNHVTSPYEKNAYYNQFINSASLDYATTTAYMNVSDINRFTIGLGMTFNKFYIDLTCLAQWQHGDFYPFNTQAGKNNIPNDVPASRVNLNRTKGMITLGYRF